MTDQPTDPLEHAAVDCFKCRAKMRFERNAKKRELALWVCSNPECGNVVPVGDPARKRRSVAMPLTFDANCVVCVEGLVVRDRLYNRVYADVVGKRANMLRAEPEQVLCGCVRPKSGKARKR